MTSAKKRGLYFLYRTLYNFNTTFRKILQLSDKCLKKQDDHILGNAGEQTVCISQGKTLNAARFLAWHGSRCPVVQGLPVRISKNMNLSCYCLFRQRRYYTIFFRKNQLIFEKFFYVKIQRLYPWQIKPLYQIHFNGTWKPLRVPRSQGDFRQFLREALFHWQ